VAKKDWMGITTAEIAPADVAVDPPPPLAKDSAVTVCGLQSKPELNGKAGVIVKDANEAGRFGVRLEGRADAMALKGANLQPLPAFDALGVSVPCLRSFRNAFAALTSGMTCAQVVEGCVRPLTGASRASLARALQCRGADDEAGRPLVAPATVPLIASHASASRSRAEQSRAEQSRAEQSRAG
jgi:hypothetical protein